MNPPSDDRSASTDLRQLLIGAALEILREPDTPLELRKVAERAGKSRTAPYLVFGKESEGGGLLALRIAVAAEGAREMRTRMAAAAQGVDDPVEALRRVALAFLGFVEDNRRLFRLMYGPEINALADLGEEGLLSHPESRALLEERDEAGRVVERILTLGQKAELLLPDDPDRRWPEPEGLAGDTPDRPRTRYLQIAWAAMIGFALLRDDELLRAVGWTISREVGARLVVDSVFGLDPGVVGPAARSFLASHSLGEEEAEEQAEEEIMAAGDVPDSVTLFERAEPGFLGRLLGGRRSPGDRREMRMRVSPEDVVREDGVQEDEAKRAGEEPDRHLDDPGEIVRISRPASRPKPEPAAPVDADRPAPEPAALEPTLGDTLRRYSGLRRAAQARNLVARAWILWIDDHPEWIRHEAEALRRLGARVQVVSSTAQARALLEAQAAAEAGAAGVPGYGVILSDIARGDDPIEGIRVLPVLRRLAPRTPVIFFIADLRPEMGTPPGAFGITNRTDELFHLVVDALEGR